MRFDFASPQRILFGAGCIKEVPSLARQYGRRAFLVAGQFDLPGPSLAEALDKGGFEIVSFVVPGEPTIPLVTEAVERARQACCDVVIGLGGGSVIDTGKAVSALLTNRGGLLEYLEVIGQGRPLAVIFFRPITPLL